MYASDIDGDSDPDALFASGSFSSPDRSKIAWYENTGGSFSDQNVITTEVEAAQSVYASDLDGDGDQDVLSASLSDNKIAWYENLGGGDFGPQIVITSKAGQAQSVRTADLDGDGDQDVLSASQGDNKVAWYENEGDGSFSNQKVLNDDAEGATAVYATDVTGNGFPDVISASSKDNKIAWYKNTGGSFSDQNVITTEAQGAQSVYAADLDGDGDQDVLSASEGDNKVAWYENKLKDPTGPPAPTDLKATPGNKKVKLDWSPGGSSDPAGYKVYRSTSSFSDVSSATEVVTLSDGSSYTDDELTNGTKYYYRVTALKEVGGEESAPSGQASATPTVVLSTSIEGVRITPQTRPSKQNAPKDAVPYPPNRKSLKDQVEVTRYPADHVVLRARVELNDSFSGSVEDISVEGTLAGQPMDTVIRDSVDFDKDGKIDALPFDHHRTGDGTTYADVLLVSAQELENGAENLSLKVTATTASGSEAQASESISLYYAEQDDTGRTFDPQTDGYRFGNLKGLSYQETATILLSYGITGPFWAVYEQWKSYQGRCFGMAGTAGVYFDQPGKKVFSGETYEQPASDTETRQQIADYHLAQNIPGITPRLDNPDLMSEYDTAKQILENGSTPMLGIKYGKTNQGEVSYHAVLSTKLTVLGGEEAIFEVHDSNFPGTTYDFSYNLSAESINQSPGLVADVYTDDIEAFATVNVDEVPFFPDGDWFRSIIADLVDGTGKVFAANFSSSGESSSKTSSATQSGKTGGEVRVLVENQQGERAGYLGDGTKVNEIDGAVVRKLVSDSSTGEKASYVAVPPGGTYTASITTSASGDVRFEHAVPTDNSKAEINTAEDIPFGSSSSGTYNEEDEEIALDKDGDGTVEETIPTESSTLPVELASFDAIATEGGVRLTWQTASETNNAGFEVQRQKEKKGWTQVGYVESKAEGGTTTETKSYSYTATGLSVGTHQFRLKQIDLDGSSTLTDPVSVDIRMREAVKLKPPTPNPTSSDAMLSFAVKEQTETTVTLYNTLGQQVATVYEGTPQAGERQTVQVDASGLPSGTYFIRLRAGEKARTQRLTVMR